MCKFTNRFSFVFAFTIIRQIILAYGYTIAGVTDKQEGTTKNPLQDLRGSRKDGIPATAKDMDQ